MAGAVQTATNQDSVLIAFLDRQQINIVDLQAPVTKKIKGAIPTVRVNQKGRDQLVTADVRTNFKAGLPNMDYPAGVSYKRDRLKTVPVDQAVTYEIDRATYEDYRNGDKQVLSNMAQETDLLMRGFMERKEFFLSGDGSGKVGVLASGSTSTVLNLAVTPTGAHAAALGVSQLKPEVAYDLYSSAGTLLAANIEIAEGTVDTTNNQVTLTAALGGGAPAAGAYLVPAGSWYNLPHGFSYLIAGGKTGYWEGISVTNRNEYQTPYTNAAGQEISNALIERTLQKHALRNGTGLNATFKIFASPSVISIYKTPGWNMFRFSAGDGAGEYSTSFKGARYEDSIFEPFPKADADVMYGVDLSDWVYVEQTPMGPFKGADGLLFRQKQGTNSHGKGEFYMQYGCSDNFTINSPHKHWVIRNLDVSNAATIYNFNATT
jgi:hypothetical protein